MSESIEMQPITADLVRELKRTGRGDYAQKLIKAQHQMVLDARREALNDIKRKDASIKRVKGYCTQDGCMERGKEGGSLCEYHHERHKKYARTKEKKNEKQ